LVAGRTMKLLTVDGYSPMEPTMRVVLLIASQMERESGFLRMEMLLQDSLSRIKLRLERMKMNKRKSQKEMK